MSGLGNNFFLEVNKKPFIQTTEPEHYSRGNFSNIIRFISDFLDWMAEKDSAAISPLRLRTTRGEIKT